MANTDLILEPATLEEWWKSYRLVRTASFFQSPDWSDIWCTHAGSHFKPSPLKAVFPSGKTVHVPLTVQELRAGLGSVWHGSVAGTYGGWLCGEESGLSPDEVTVLVRSLFTYCGSLTFRPFPVLPGSGFADGAMANMPDGPDASRGTGPASTRPFPNSVTHGLPGVTVSDDRTWLLDCEGGYAAVEEKWAREKPALLRNISKARRNGVRIRRAETRSDISEYHRLYLRSVERWDPPPVHVYPESLFVALVDGGGPERTDARELWLAEYGGKVVAGAVMLRGRNHSAYWHGAMDAESSKVRPMNLLVASIVASTCGEGIRWFDFNPSMGIAGVERFKSSFGAVAAACPVLQKTGSAVKVAASAGRMKRRVKNLFRR